MSQFNSPFKGEMSCAGKTEVLRGPSSTFFRAPAFSAPATRNMVKAERSIRETVNVILFTPGFGTETSATQRFFF